MNFLLIKKEERPGPEVAKIAKEVIEKTSEQIKELKTKLQSLTEKLSASQDDSEVHTLAIILFGGYVPLAIETCSESLKACTPNMKKKKDASFDQLKAEVIKPLKEVCSSIKEHFVG